MSFSPERHWRRPLARLEVLALGTGRRRRFCVLHYAMAGVGLFLILRVPRARCRCLKSSSGSGVQRHQRDALPTNPAATTQGAELRNMMFDRKDRATAERRPTSCLSGHGTRTLPRTP